MAMPLMKILFRVIYAINLLFKMPIWIRINLKQVGVPQHFQKVGI